MHSKKTIKALSSVLWPMGASLDTSMTHNDSQQCRKNMQDRNKNAGLTTYCQQDTQKKTGLQWCVGTNRRLVRPSVTTGVAAIVGVSQAVWAEDMPQQVESAAPSQQSFVLDQAVNPAAEVKTEQYRQQVAMPTVVIDYQDIAQSVWQKQLEYLGVAAIFSLLIIAAQFWCMRKFSATFTGVVIMFAIGFALVALRVKLAA